MDGWLSQSKWYEAWFAANTRAGVVAVFVLCVLLGGFAGALIGWIGPLYAFGGILAIAAALVMLRSIHAGLTATIAVICLLPFAAIPLPIGFSPTFLDLCLVALYLVWLLRLARRRQQDFVATPVGLPLLVFIVLAVAAFIAGLAHAHLTAQVLRRFAEVLMALALFFLVVNTVRTKKQLSWLVKVIILAGFLAAFIGVVLYVLPQDLTVRLLSALGRFNYPTGTDVIQYVEDNPDLPMRATSTSVNPNVLGGLLILVTSVSVAQLFAPKPVLPRWALVAAVAFMGLCLYLTYSRGSLVGLAVGLAAIGLARYRKLLLLLALVAVVALFLPQTQEYIVHFIEGIRGEDLATQMRFGEYKDALNLISRYPWLGVGFAGTPDIDLYIGVSSVYLLIAEQMGLVGLSAFLLVIAVTLASTWRAWRSMTQKDCEPILLGFSAAILGILVGGFFDHYFVNLDFPHSVAMFWMYVGLAIATARLANAPPGQDPASARS